MFKHVWSKALELVCRENMIVNAPGAENIKVCASSSNRPHIVTVFENRKVTYDCRNNENLTLCLHSIAVAEKGAHLLKLLNWYIRRVNSLLICGVCQRYPMCQRG